MVLGNFQYRGFLQRIIVVLGPAVLAVGVGWGCLTYFLSSIISLFWDTTRYRLKYCLKGPLSLKTNNQVFSSVILCTFIEVKVFPSRIS